MRSSEKMVSIRSDCHSSRVWSCHLRGRRPGSESATIRSKRTIASRLMPKKLPSLNPPKRKPDDRPPPSARGYGRNWQKVRAQVLVVEPCCRVCAERGLVVLATDVDHDIPLADGGTNEGSNLVPLCHSCHSTKTAKQDGGLGRARHRGPD